MLSQRSSAHVQSISHILWISKVTSISRYLDDELILGIDGNSLEKFTGAIIPTVSELTSLFINVMPYSISLDRR